MNNLLRFLMAVIFALNVSVAFAASDDDEYQDDESYAEDVVDDEDEADEEEDDVVANTTSSAETKSVVKRMDCKTIKTKISELTKNGNDADTLDALQKQYRKDCVVRSASAGQRVARNGRSATPPTDVASDKGLHAAAAVPGKVIRGAGAKSNSLDALKKAVATSTAVSGVITDEQKDMCDKLFDKMAGFSDDIRVTLKETYDTYCAKSVAAPDGVVKMTLLVLNGDVASGNENAPTEEEINAQIIANLEAGLCGDGTKPNKYGCCTGEKFKDMGNLQFGCCNEETGECFPTMF